MKSIYTKYKERLIEISGKSRSIFSRKGDSKLSCDLSKFFENNDLFLSFIEGIWNGNDKPFELLNEETLDSLYNYSKGDTEELDKKADTSAKNKSLRKMVSNIVNSFEKLKKEIVDIAKETGRYELYVGYPFVEGNVGRDISLKAPLILFPVKINITDDSHVSIEKVKDMPITLNKALLFAYAREKKINIDDMELEFGDDFSKKFKGLKDVVDYLKRYHINLSVSRGRQVTPLEATDGGNKGNVTLENHCVIGRDPIANSIYLDYNELEKRKSNTNGAIEALIYSSSPKSGPVIDSPIYTINKLDYTQEKAVERVNNEGNMVIYGPPGTGKSQTIVNIISDALAKKKRVLIVSQKKAALDVVYNRLGDIKNKAMFIVDPQREKETFYKRCYETHSNIRRYDCSEEKQRHEILEKKIQELYQELQNIFSVLYKPCDFGISLQEMYEQSSQISKNSYDYEIYEQLINRKDLLGIRYDNLVKSLGNINQNERRALYYKYKNMKKKNAIIEHLRSDLDVYKVDTIIDKLEKILSSKTLGFDISKYPYCSYLISHYIYNIDKDFIDLDSLVSFIAKQNGKKGFMGSSEFEKDLKESFEQAMYEIKDEIRGLECFKEGLTDKGYQLIVGAILNGNVNMLRNLKSALSNYKELKDTKLELANLDDTDKEILDFAYEFGDTSAKYNQILDNFMPIRMYVEIVKEEQEKKEELAKIMNFPSIKNEIMDLKKKQSELSKKIAANSFNNDYIDNYDTNRSNKEYLYQISKQGHSWSIRKFIKEYQDLIMDLYPCWLLSPENVSTILPLTKDMFDIVLIDEASQVFIENTLPTIYRGKHVVVAGDSKQLRPSATFMKRYMGFDADNEDLDPSTEATLEVESLLDLATSRLPSTHLNYHYRSKSSELIDFSNSYFYEDKLEISPNLMGAKKNKAVNRIKVDGRWANRRNEEEAKTIVLLLKKTLFTRKNKESIGIIAFNSEQALAIEEEIRNECKRDPKFAAAVLEEQNRFENGEDVSLFVKNLENVQGDERDIIMLSVGYAPNENGKVLANFGSLSVEGGENRLNVAITRAKKKTFVVTSIEPEELRVDNSKNAGPKILQKYLSYVRAVSENKKDEVRVCLNNKKESVSANLEDNEHIAKEIKKALEKLGYKVDVKVGNTKKKIDLAVYDRELDRYLIGIDCINKEFQSLEEMVESTVYHDDFLKSRGWNIFHVWTRDWWNNKGKVLSTIVKEIEKAKKEYALVEPSVKKISTNKKI